MKSKMLIVCALLMSCVFLAGSVTSGKAQDNEIMRGQLENIRNQTRQAPSVLSPGQIEQLKQLRQQRMEGFRQQVRSVLEPGQIEQLEQLRQQRGQLSPAECKAQFESLLTPDQIEQLQELRPQGMGHSCGPPQGMGQGWGPPQGTDQMPGPWFVVP